MMDAVGGPEWFDTGGREMPQERPPIHVGEALEQAHAERNAEEDRDSRSEVVMEQIADALIRIQWSVEAISKTVQTTTHR